MGGRISGVRARVRTRRVESVASPAAGSDWSVTVPGGHLWRPMGIVATFTADATVANRFPFIRASIDGQLVWASPYLHQTSASQAPQFSLFPMAGVLDGAFHTMYPMPALELPAGATIEAVTVGIQNGDEWSGITIGLIDEWIARGPIDLEQPGLEIVGIIEPSA